MSKLDSRIHEIQLRKASGYWETRILTQIKVGSQISAMENHTYDSLLIQVAEQVLEELKRDGTLSSRTALSIEEKLAPLSPLAKAYVVHCVAHAHIDMNWMWRFDETVSATLDTFKTMLALLREYPDFHFSQSQASTYRIVEEYGTADLLEEIRRYVQEGRWEVTASTWVEADKNMPNAESMARHLLYTRKYLSKLLYMPDEAFQLDFEPDTFGHSANVPEILSQGGVSYYYHCRGANHPALSWWQAPSGKKVLAYCDPLWYGTTHVAGDCVAAVDETFALRAIELCRENKTDSLLRVYGVGDHGGGPSRRDIERILDMQQWPVYPTLRFSTYHAFFADVAERFGDVFPVYDTEMNPFATGCYTSQSRIKLANRIGESMLYDAEQFAAIAGNHVGFAYRGDRFQSAWEKVLFNQFHDILTGSCVPDTKEYAMGIFQEAIATANTERTGALRALAEKIDTTCFRQESDEFVEGLLPKQDFGAGVGNGITAFRVSQVGRGTGLPIIYHVFNPSPYAREGLAECCIWDWDDTSLSYAEFRDEKGNVVPHQVISQGNEINWGHYLTRVLIPVKVPAGGYSSYGLYVNTDKPVVAGPIITNPILEYPHEFVLENELVRVEFDTQSGGIRSYIDKQTGFDWISGKQTAGFRFVQEDADRGMSAWIVGRHMSVCEAKMVHIKYVPACGARLRDGVEISADFGEKSGFRALFTLEKDSRLLHINVDCDWQEKAVPHVRMPQLGFVIPLSVSIPEYIYDVPAGTITRKPINMDMPGNSFIAVAPENTSTGFVLTTDSKYGYRGDQDSLYVDLIRMSYDPDPNPEYGKHTIKMAIGPSGADRASFVRDSFDAWHGFQALTASVHDGAWPASSSLITVESETAVLQALKLAEDGSGHLIARLYTADGEAGEALLKLPMGSIKEAWKSDIHEVPSDCAYRVENGIAKIDIGKGELITVRLNVL